MAHIVLTAVHNISVMVYLFVFTLFSLAPSTSVKMLPPSQQVSCKQKPKIKITIYSNLRSNLCYILKVEYDSIL
jgi:hypothetical protein